MRNGRSPAVELAARVVHGGDGAARTDLARTLEAAQARVRSRYAAERFGPHAMRLRVALRAFEAGLLLLPVLQARALTVERS